MPKIIVASRYLKPAAKGTRGNLVKYIATRETVQKYSPKQKNISATENQQQLIFELLKINSDGKKLPEYSDYLKNPSKENASELLSELLEQSADMIADKEILVKYVAERPGVEKIGKHGLFSDSDDEIILTQAQKNIAEHQGNVWSHVISLTREDAERLGYTTPEMWRNLIMRHTDDIAKAQNIRLENLHWYAAFHNTAHHPHIHLLVYSTDIKEGFLTENGIEQIKSAFANDIFHNELYQVYEKQTAVRDKLQSEAENVMKNMLSELQNNNQSDPQLELLVLKLQTQLRNSKGKKVYGYLQPNVKKTVDQIVAELAKNPVLKKMYEEWCALEQQKYETYTSAVQKFPSLEKNKVFKPIKNSVICAVLEMDFSVQELDSEIFVEDGESNLGEAQSSSGLYIKWTAEYKSACSELYKKQNVSKALELFHAEAERGNILALHDLGKMYRNGLLGDENIPKADEYFQKALQGFLALEPTAKCLKPYVQYRIGKMFALGLGTEQDYTKAFGWFEKSAAGNKFAQYSLGSLYFYGNGVAQNFEKAFEYYRLSADQDNAYACYEVAKMFRDGIGVEKNSEQAEMYFPKAYNGFLKIAQDNPDDKILYRLGVMTFSGTGCDTDRELGIEYIKKSAELGNEYAQAFLENSNRYVQTAAQNAVISMLFSFGRLISDDYNRNLHGQKFRTEHKLKAAIRRKKQALGMKENPLENPQFK
ncbi:MAG: relaxase MobL [Oscillospiraceae bacterium]|nr:relaxase MobL [Oscillospiraceae bacterium]